MKRKRYKIPNYKNLKERNNEKIKKMTILWHGETSKEKIYYITRYFNKIQTVQKIAFFFAFNETAPLILYLENITLFRNIGKRKSLKKI